MDAVTAAHDGDIQMIDSTSVCAHDQYPRGRRRAGAPNDAGGIRALINEQGSTPNISPKGNHRWKPCFSQRLYREPS